MQDINLVRNVAIFGHAKSGKTSLAEALLFTTGKTKRLGKVDDGSSVMDFDPEEINRKATINSSFNHYDWHKNSIYLIDTPGDDNFLNDAAFSAQVADNAVFVVEANQNLKSQTEKIATFVCDRNLPSVIVVNKMDRERANFDNTLSAIKEKLPFKPAVVHLPIGSEDAFKGVIDLVSQKAFAFDGDKGALKEIDIPADMTDDLVLHRDNLMELLIEMRKTIDKLLELLLDEWANDWKEE